METELKTIKDRLQRILDITGLSVAAFERKLGWSNGSFSKISDTLSFGRAKTIVDTFGISREWLLTGKGEMVAAQNATTAAVAPSPQTASSVPQTNFTNVEVSALLPDFDKTYRVATDTLKPSIEVGDVIFLKQIGLDGVINGNPYLIFSERYGVILSIVERSGNYLVCVSADRLELSAANVKEIYKIVGQFKYAVNMDCIEKSMYVELKQHSERLTEIVNKSNEISKGLTDNNSGVLKQMDMLLAMLNKKM